MLATTRLATTRRELAGPQVSPEAQSLLVRQLFWPYWQVLAAVRLVVVVQMSLGNTEQKWGLVQSASVEHLVMLQSFEQMPRQVLPLPQSLFLVQAVALLLLQYPRQVTPLVLQSLSWLHDVGMLFEQYPTRHSAS